MRLNTQRLLRLECDSGRILHGMRFPHKMPKNRIEVEETVRKQGITSQRSGLSGV